MTTATLGGGCFWCLEAVFVRVKGVLESVSGYAGGEMEHPSYQDVSTGETGHAEVVRLSFDPAQISYRRLLEIFFAIHDPTTPNRQGNDVGSQYRSVIFCHGPEQEAEARALIAELDRAGSRRIVTQVRQAPQFYLAEGYHQNYCLRSPGQPYCHYMVEPKVAKFKRHFPELVKE